MEPARLGKVARLQDVANAAEVSIATVSRFLNGGLTLPPATAKRIERAIHALDYRPNSHARRLSLGRSETIGLVVPAIDNPFFAGFADAVELAAEAKGLSVLLCISRNQLKRELDYLSLLRSNQVDGLLFLTNRHDTSALTKVINAARHVVVVDEDVNKVSVPKLFVDNERGGALAGEHLISAGHRKLAFLGGPRGLISTTERLAGFRQAVAANAGTTIVHETYGEYTWQDGRRATDDLLDRGDTATGVFVTSDMMTCGVLERLRERQIAIPDDLSLITFDDASPLALFATPLTAIRQPIGEMGARSVELLMWQIAGNWTARPPVVRMPVELVARASVAAPSLRRSALRTSIKRKQRQ